MYPLLSKLFVAASNFDVEVKKVFRRLIQTDTVAAAGSTIADATLIAAGRNVVTAADGTKGVVLPPAKTDMMVEIVNTVSNQTLLVYPNSSSEQINAITAGNAFSLVGGARGAFFCDTDGHWYVAAANLTGTSTSSTTGELDTLHSVTPGTTSASKALVVDANKRLDTLVLGTLNLGAGAGTAVTATAAEVNVLHSVSAGTVAASSAVVAGAAKNVDTLGIALVSVGTGGIETGLTAHSGGTQAAALALSATKSVHEVTTVGAGNDSVALPAATGSGVVHFVKNSAAANSLQLFATTPSTIDGVASATGVAVAAGKGRLLVDADAGNWISVAGA